jgi:lipopolysaccharide biosynthesis glycosyltransferase
MSTAFVTLLDDRYYTGGALSIYTLLKSTPDFNYPIVIIDWGQLSSPNKQKLKILYPNITFRQIPITDYSDIAFDKVNRSWNYNCSYRFEIFNLCEFDNILFFDSDIIFQQNMNYVVRCGADFAAIQRPLERGLQFRGKRYFNGGLMLVGKKYLNTQIKADLIGYARQAAPRDSRDTRVTSRKWVGNEPILNRYFEQYVTFIEKKYNFCIDECDTNTLKETNNLHFIGEHKPWTHNSLDKYINEALTLTNTKVRANILEKKLVKFANSKFNLLSRDYPGLV